MATTPYGYVKNNYEKFPYVPQNCVRYLMNNNELIWKLLKYTTPDAWRKPNLTLLEKEGLLYSGQKDRPQDDFNVFFDVGQDDVWTKETTVMRNYIYEVIPDNTVTGTLLVAFEIFSHNMINTLSNYTTRVDMISQQIVETLNGAEIDGVGTLWFHQQVTRRLRIYETGIKPYRGKMLLMANNAL